MGYPILQYKVIEYLGTRIGETITLTEMVKHLPDLGEHQIQNAMATLIRTNKVPGLVRVTAGRIWRLESPTLGTAPVASPSLTGPSKRIYEEVYVLNNGNILAQDEHGELYWITPIGEK